MRWTLAAALAATLLGAGMTAPAARAHGGVEVGVAIGFRRTIWRPAHYETRVERFVASEGFWREETVPASVGFRFDFGCRRFVRVVLRPATVVRTWVPPVLGERVVRVVVPGRWERCCD